MSAYRESLILKVIRKYGFEHKKVIWFARRAESGFVDDAELTMDFMKIMR